MTQTAAAISPIDKFNAFISDVDSGKTPSNKWVKLAVKRHKKDLKASKAGPFRFDHAEAERVLSLFQLLRHTKGEYAKQPFQLLPWQAFLIGSLYGWRKKSDGTRRYTRAYIEVARKNGKTEVAAGIGLIEAFFNREYGAEVYSAANKLDQASICWKSAVTMAKFLQKDVEEISDLFEVHESFNNRRIFSRSNNCFFAPVASDSKTLDGLNPQCAIIDEYHEAQDDTILRVMETGMGARRQPLIFIITTAGFNRNGPCFQLRKVVSDILAGHKRDESFFGLVFTLDDEDDWENESNWIKANPSLGLTPSLDFMQREYIKAKNEGEGARINFLTKNLNIWTTVQSAWIKDDVWVVNQEPIDMESLRGRLCYGGLDLAFKRDITAFVLFFPAANKDERHVVLSYFWVPDENAAERSREDGVPYVQWVADGFLNTTPGNATDYDFVQQKILDLSEVYSIRVVGYDAAFGTQLANSLTASGIEMDRVHQSYQNMNEAILRIDELVNFKKDADSPVTGRINHLGNPILRWMAGNVVLKRDGGGRMILDKAKAIERIDGISALANAIIEWITEEGPKTGPSKYESEELVIV